MSKKQEKSLELARTNSKANNELSREAFSFANNIAENEENINNTIAEIVDRINGNIAVIKFYNEIKDTIKVTKGEYLNYLERNNYIIHLKNRYIATENAISESYMVNTGRFTVDMDKFTLHYDGYAHILPLGQKTILNYFISPKEIDGEQDGE